MIIINMKNGGFINSHDLKAYNYPAKLRICVDFPCCKIREYRDHYDTSVRLLVGWGVSDTTTSVIYIWYNLFFSYSPAQYHCLWVISGLLNPTLRHSCVHTSWPNYSQIYIKWNIHFIYVRVLMFPRLSVPKVLFSFSILPCRTLPCCEFPYPSFQWSKISKL